MILVMMLAAAFLAGAAYLALVLALMEKGEDDGRDGR